jgi:hypothetical protein
MCTIWIFIYDIGHSQINSARVFAYFLHLLYVRRACSRLTIFYDSLAYLHTVHKTRGPSLWDNYFYHFATVAMVDATTDIATVRCLLLQLLLLLLLKM